MFYSKFLFLFFFSLYHCGIVYLIMLYPVDLLLHFSITSWGLLVLALEAISFTLCLVLYVSKTIIKKIKNKKIKKSTCLDPRLGSVISSPDFSLHQPHGTIMAKRSVQPNLFSFLPLKLSESTQTRWKGVEWMRMRSLMTQAPSRNPSSLLKPPLDQLSITSAALIWASLYLCPTNCQLLATPLIMLCTVFTLTHHHHSVYS